MSLEGTPINRNMSITMQRAGEDSDEKVTTASLKEASITSFQKQQVNAAPEINKDAEKKKARDSIRSLSYICCDHQSSM